MDKTHIFKDQQSYFQQKVSICLEYSLTEEQRFLQAMLTGKIKTYSHEEVIADLRKVLHFSSQRH